MSDVNRDPVRWERSMTQDKEGQYVAFHDYALLLESHDALRTQLSEAQARLATKRELLERLRFLCTDLIPDETAEEVRGSTEVDDIISCLIDTTAAPVSQAAQTVAVPDEVTKILGEMASVGAAGASYRYVSMWTRDLRRLLSAPATPAKVDGGIDSEFMDALDRGEHLKGLGKPEDVARAVAIARQFPFSAAQPAKVEDDVARDAARYRFLRMLDWFTGPLCVVKDPQIVFKRGSNLGCDCPSRDRLDAAIDAAMSAAQAQKKEV